MKIFLLQRVSEVWKFSDLFENQEENESGTEKIILDGTEMSERINVYV